MQEWIKHKLDQIDELFPSERIERSKKRWTALWNKNATPDRYPFVTSPFMFDYYDDVHTPEERLRVSLDEIIVRGKLRDDYVPTIFPGCRQSTIPNMFGAREIVVGRDHSAEKLLNQIEDVDHLPEPSMGPGTVAREWLDMQAYFLEETEGRLPVHVTDMQGPADVCGQLLSYDSFFISPYTDPEHYSRLMNKVTDAFIMFWGEQERLLGDQFVGTHLFGYDWVPPHNGATLSADSLVMISPEFYDEYYGPYLEKIGKAFGGLTIHSCGNFAQVIPRLCQDPNLRGINAGQMTVAEMLRAGLTNDKVVIAWCLVDDATEMFRLIEQHQLRVDLTMSCIIPFEQEKLKHPETWTDEDWDMIRHNEDTVLENLPVI